MKQLLITIAALVLVGCEESQQSAPAPKEQAIEPTAEVPAQQLAPAPEAKPVDPAAETIRKNLNNSQKPQINNELLSAVNKLNIEAVKQHISAGSDLNAIEDRMYGLTPLHILAGNSLRDMEKTKELIELLITNGANVNALANATYAYKQRTPLDIAQKKVELGLPPVYADLLRKHGGKTAEELKAEGK